MKLLDGIIAAKAIEENLREEIKKMKSLTLGIFQVGDEPASNKYISMKVKKADSLGIKTEVIKVKADITNEKLEALIKEKCLNLDGAILQLPICEHLDTQRMLDAIAIDKDVDGLNSSNDKIMPATPRGILELLNFYNISLKEKKIGIVGQSRLVGKPLTKKLISKGLNVRTFNLSTGVKGTKECDILIVAAGCHNLIGKNDVKKNAVVVDVGINTLSNKEIAGDVNFDEVEEIVSAISPVPGGVGPMTVISLFKNLIEMNK